MCAGERVFGDATLVPANVVVRPRSRSLDSDDLVYPDDNRGSGKERLARSSDFPKAAEGSGGVTRGW